MASLSTLPPFLTAAERLKKWVKEVQTGESKVKGMTKERAEQNHMQATFSQAIF